jgi:hypothetical protein
MLATGLSSNPNGVATYSPGFAELARRTLGEQTERKTSEQSKESMHPYDPLGL